MGGPGASSWRATTAARRAREGVPSAASTCPSGHLLLLRKAEQQARLLSSHPSASQRILRPPRCCLESLASVRSEARTSAMRASLSVRPRRARDARRAGAGRTIAGSGARGAAAACGARASRGVAPLPAGPWQRVASFFPSSTPPFHLLPLRSCSLSSHARCVSCVLLFRLLSSLGAAPRRVAALSRRLRLTLGLFASPAHRPPRLLRRRALSLPLQWRARVRASLSTLVLFKSCSVQRVPVAARVEQGPGIWSCSALLPC
jgi:hypothetical protein